MTKRVLLLFLALFLVGCGGANEAELPTQLAPEIVEVTVEVTIESVVEVTREIEVTREMEVTREVQVTRLVEVPVTVTATAPPVNSPTPSNTPLPTDTPLPTNTPLPTSTPTITPVPTATPDTSQTATVQALGVLGAPKGNGFYQVGVSILPGRWRSNGSSSSCYWARLDANQGLLDNHFGMAGGTVTVLPSDYEVEFDGCGTWIYVESETPVLRPAAPAPKSDGFYTVGIEVAPGQWRSTGSGSGCYWARIDAYQNIIDNHFGNAGGTVTISAGDYEVDFSGCGLWEFVGP